jgi:hypothetical protein
MPHELMTDKRMYMYVSRDAARGQLLRMPSQEKQLASTHRLRALISRKRVLQLCFINLNLIQNFF